MKYWKAIAASGLCLMLSGCALLPAEEEYGMAPVAQKYEAQGFELTHVSRGDVQLTQKINCTYVPVASEDLYFQVGGVKIDEVYVMEGDAVEAGQLLACLDMGTLETDIQSVQNQLDMARLKMEHLEENYGYQQARARLENAADRQALEEKLKELEKQYQKDRQSGEDEMSILQLRLEDFLRQKKERQIFAPSDGTITYTRPTEEGELSSKDSRMFTLVSSTLSIFRAETLYWELFEPGDSYEIAVGRLSYPATCVDPEETLGMEKGEKTEGKYPYVYLVLDDPNTALEDGDRGSLTLVLDRREDVLRLPKNTVHEAQGQTLVYYEDENGLRSYRFFEAGLEGDEWIEVLSGMEEGDNVIVK